MRRCVPSLSTVSGSAALRRNRFKAALTSSDRVKPQLGLWASAGCPQVTELASLVPGIAWLVIDMEHTPNTLQCVLSQLHSAQGSGCAAIVLSSVPRTELCPAAGSSLGDHGS